MYDIKPLEKQWEQYRKKKRRPWYVLIFTISFLLLIILGFLKYNLTDFFKLNDNKNVEIVTNSTTILTTNKALSSSEMKKPKADDVLDVAEVKPMPVISDNDHAEKVDDLPISEDIKKPRVKIETTVIEEPRKKVHLNIIETTSLSAYKDVEKRFNQSHDTDDSLFLAKSYYRKGSYEKAEYWALQTNKVNGNIEESWLIFAKSKVKLGRKNEAIRILTAYIKKSNSSQAKSLLHKIKKGTP